MKDKSHTTVTLDQTYAELSRQEIFRIRLDALRAALKAQAESYNKYNSNNSNQPFMHSNHPNRKKF